MYAEQGRWGGGLHATTGLLGRSAVSAAVPIASAVDALSPDLKEHEAHLRLMRSENYVRALGIFRKRRAPEPDPAQAAIRELQFMGHVLAWVGFSIHIAATGWRPKSVTAEQKRKTTAHATQLLNDMKAGAGLRDATSNSLLQNMLKQLCGELEGPGKRDYAGHGRERKILTTLAISLLASAQLPSDAVVEIVGECGQLYGFNVTQRSIQRYVREARRQCDVALADLRRRQET
jgi:hypothetical protein